MITNNLSTFKTKKIIRALTDSIKITAKSIMIFRKNRNLEICIFIADSWFLLQLEIKFVISFLIINNI